MDFEGIYRKSGGTTLAKEITMLFERGEPFDLDDPERFNDIGAVTSVLKNYFRTLPTPLMTHALHDEWLALLCPNPRGGSLDDGSEPGTSESIADARVAEDFRALLRRLPSAHFCTLRYLVLHLFHVQARADQNRMTARNLGVVFGPTLLRAPDLDASKELAEMGPKARIIEYCISHPELFDGNGTD